MTYKHVIFDGVYSRYAAGLAMATSIGLAMATGLALAMGLCGTRMWACDRIDGILVHIYIPGYITEAPFLTHCP